MTLSPAFGLVWLWHTVQLNERCAGWLFRRAPLVPYDGGYPWQPVHDSAAAPHVIEFGCTIPPFFTLLPSPWQYVFAQLSTPCVYVPPMASAVVRSVVLNATSIPLSTWFARPVAAFSVVTQSLATVSAWHVSHVKSYPVVGVLSVCVWWRVDKVVAGPRVPWQYVHVVSVAPHTAGFTSGAPPCPLLWHGTE